MDSTFVSKTNNKTTTWKVVLPFYGYGAISFLIASFLLVCSTNNITQHYFQPNTLAIVHLMALGWGTMVILGASHQLVPVLIEQELYSNKLGYLSFCLAAIGIPLLVYGFYFFDMGWPSKWGGRLIILAIIVYLFNIAKSMSMRKQENIHTVFLITATIWLLLTAIIGLMLIYNFTYPLMPLNSTDYLPLHAHIGIIGWFLLLVMGVGSKLIPMFLISKYSNNKLLWLIFSLVNIGLLIFICIFLYSSNTLFFVFPIFSIALAVVLFVFYCYNSYQNRVRKKVDKQMKLTLLSILMMVIPIIFLIVIILLFIFQNDNELIIISYGFIIFFGWITAIILGMTFKTLPFIIWNKVYHLLAGKGVTPNPIELFNHTIFKYMALSYLFGFILFTIGLIINYQPIILIGSILLSICSILYNWNIIMLLIHKPVKK